MGSPPSEVTNGPSGPRTSTHPRARRSRHEMHRVEGRRRAVHRRRKRHGDATWQAGADLRERLERGQLTAPDQRDAIARLLDLREHVRRQEHRGPSVPLQLVNRLRERLDHQRVEAVGRLVENQDGRIRRDRLDDAELAAHAVRVVAHRPPEIDVADIEPTKQMLEPGRADRTLADCRQEREKARGRRAPGRSATRPGGSRRAFSPRAPASGSGGRESTHPRTSGAARSSSSRIVVVLPAPFGPRNPNTSPSPTSSETPSRPTTRP